MTARPRLLLIDENAEDRALTAVVLAGDNPTAELAKVGDAPGFVEAMAAGPHDLIVTSLVTGWARGAFLLRTIRERQPRAAIIVFTDEEDRESAIAAMRAGAADYLVKSAAGYLGLAKAVRSALKMASGDAAARPATTDLQSPVPKSPTVPPDRAPQSASRVAAEQLLSRARLTEPELLDALANGESRSSLREVEIAVDVMKSVLSDLLEDSGCRPVRVTESRAEGAAEATPEPRDEIDQTEILKRQREALLAKVAELERSNADLSQFAYIASHELQEPLRMVEKYSGLLKMDIAGKIQGPADESLGFLLDGARRMQALVDDLLAFSRIGYAQGSVEPCDCREMLESAWTTLEASVEASGAEIEVGDLPFVAGDASQLTQVFVNLLGNAIKFRSDREPRIRVAAEQVDGQWQISVRDNGIGIAAAELDRVFNIFNRLHPERGGTGIGLALCKRIVERHGGQLWAESEPGEGSTFFVALPSWESEEAAVPTVVRFEKGSRRRAE